MARNGTKRSKRMVRSGEYIVFRSPKTGHVRKHRSDQRFIAEVRSRATGKRLRYLNDRDKKGKPIPRKFASTQLAFYKATKVSREKLTRTKISEAFKAKKGLTFPVSSDDFIANQIPSQSHRTFNRLIERHGRVLFNVSLVIPGFSTPIQSEITNWTVKLTETQFAWALASIIASLYRSVQIRFSPKKNARNEKEANWRNPSFMDVELVIWKVTK